MEQPRYRGTAAAKGDNDPGWSWNPPGDGNAGGGPTGDSAAWNGSCSRRPEEEKDQAPWPSPGTEHRDGSCGLTCQHRAHGQEEEEDDGEDGAGKGTRRTRRRQRLRPEKEESGRRESRRHRPLRKRSRGDGVGFPEPTGYRELLSQARALAAETGGRLLGSCCRLSSGDLGWAPAGVRSWGRRARSGSLRAARGLRCGARLCLRLLWMLLALLLLLLVLLLGCLRLCWRAGAAGAGRLVGTRWVTRLRRTWGIPRENRLSRCLRDWLWKRQREPPCGDRTGWEGDAAAGADAGGPGAGGPGAGSREELRRLLALAELPEEELNPFQVLGVELTASDAELRRAYRRLAVLVHPDKNEHPRAEAAFKVLRAAWDIVSSPERRKEFEIKWMAQSELTRSVGEFLSRLQDDLREAMNTMVCSKCQGKHRRFEMDRDPLSARYCAECGELHPAEEGDFWAESSLLGLKITYLAMMEGRVYDITEWAGCQRVGISPDTHRAPYHISFGSRGAGRTRNPSKGSPPPAADLQDFFARVFQGGSGGASSPGGPFPPPPAPPGAAAAPPRAEGAAPKGDPKHKRRKKVRRPFQR